MEGDIINVKWTWAKDEHGNYPKGKRIPIEVPDEFISDKNLRDSTAPLSQFVDISTEPFQINFKTRESQSSTYFSL